MFTFLGLYFTKTGSLDSILTIVHIDKIAKFQTVRCYEDRLQTDRSQTEIS